MKKVKLPDTDSVQKLAEFWDTHDATDFQDQLEDVTTPVFDRKPVRDRDAEFGWSYERKRVVRKGDTVSPNAKKGVKVAVRDLLP